ncbi:MAG TPA: hypothetical protein VFG03_18940 [Telluria sp.]|nr:hypothetical protein [Telluria sp.]
MNKARFRYALEPILLTRRWELDALMLELGDSNSALARQQNALDELDERIAIAQADWLGGHGAAGALTVERFARYSRYLDDLARLRGEAQVRVETLAAERDALVERVVAAKRGVEAVEQHRDDMKAKFVQMRASGDFKLADDQWNTLVARSVSHAA